VVKPGQVVKVRVLEVDLKRQRIALSMRLDDAAGGAPRRGNDAPPRTAAEPRRPPRRPDAQPSRESRGAVLPGAMALAFAKLKK